ncbi:hypothetical protein DWY69_15685 [Eisenbergiella massiliensis]|uniref:Uncharacterized protein n=1 Tax=Eisenbergiella massiliensis TaxID=1720294 RepID=A0A3E3HX89_9FIRM|nr:hypothetical protein DXC51_24205 [Eisenbergiella massiliensis]RGE70659.1 hypothetical protein DWY69_15685 [Eisenbergiella massiliensis]
MQFNSRKKCSEKMAKKGQKRIRGALAAGFFAFFLFAGSVYFGGGRIMKENADMKYVPENGGKTQVGIP